MKKLIVFSMLLLGIFYSCDNKEPTPKNVEVGQVWLRTDSLSHDEIIYETLTVLVVKDGYATVDYNGWWLSVRPIHLIQSVYTYDRTLSNEELSNVIRNIPNDE